MPSTWVPRGLHAGLAGLLHEHGGVGGPQAVWQAGRAVAQDVLGRQDAALDGPKAAIPRLQLWQGAHGAGRRGQLLIAVARHPAGTVRLASATKVLAKRMLKYHRICEGEGSTCPVVSALLHHWTAPHRCCLPPCRACQHNHPCPAVLVQKGPLATIARLDCGGQTTVKC